MRSQLISSLLVASALVMCVSVASAESALFNCDGVYQARPCGEGTKGEPIANAPKVSRLSSPNTASTQSDADEEIRAQLSLEKMEDEIIAELIQDEDKKDVASRSNGSQVNDKALITLQSLDHEVRAISKNLSRIIQQNGLSLAGSRVNRLFVQTNAVCTKNTLDKQINYRRKCEMIRRSLSQMTRNIEDQRNSQRTF